MQQYIKITPQNQDKFFDLLREFWHYRNVLGNLAKRDVILRYRQTYLGIIWVIIQPLITTSVFSLILGRFINLPSSGQNYFLFTFVALLPWNFFSNIINRNSHSLTQNMQLITKIYFPRIMLPIGSSFSALLDHLISIGALFGILFLFAHEFSIRILMLPLFFVATYLFSLGLSLIFSALNVKYRDIAYALPFMLQVLFFVSPIAYSPEIIPKQFLPLYYLNPISGYVSLYRWAIFGESQALPAFMLFETFAISLLIIILGFWTFHKTESEIADVI